MNVSENTPRPSTRLSKGNVVLTNARLIDTRPIKARFEAFTDIHRQYIEAHEKVTEAEALDDTELKRIRQLEGALDRALDHLFTALVLDGERKRNPFARFSPMGPAQINGLSFGDKVTAAQELAATLHKSLGLAEATHAAANVVVEEAARLKESLSGRALRRNYLNLARQERDALGLQWDDAYKALRHVSKSMVETPRLHAVLFAQPKRPARKGKTNEVPDTVEVEPSDPPATPAVTTPVVVTTADDVDDSSGSQAA